MRSKAMLEPVNDPADAGGIGEPYAYAIVELSRPLLLANWTVRDPFDLSPVYYPHH